MTKDKVGEKAAAFVESYVNARRHEVTSVFENKAQKAYGLMITDNIDSAMTADGVNIIPWNIVESNSMKTGPMKGIIEIDGHELARAGREAMTAEAYRTKGFGTTLSGVILMLSVAFGFGAKRQHRKVKSYETTQRNLEEALVGIEAGTTPKASAPQP